MEHAPEPLSQPPDRGVPLSIVQASALLGGASAAAVVPDDANRSLVASLDAEQAWLTPGGRAADADRAIVRQFALECCSLKLRTFYAACRLLIGAKRDGSQPFGLDQVQLCLRDHPGSLAPARWNFDVEIVAAAGDGPPLRRGLGNVLACLLLTNDQRGAEQAIALADELARNLERARPTLSGPLDGAARAVFAASPAGDRTAVLHPVALRRVLAGDGVPAAVWQEIGELLLRLVADVPGFSLGDAPLMDVCARLNVLLRRLDVAVFGAEARRAAVQQALHQKLARLREGG